MYRIKLANGDVLQFDSLEALTGAIHAGAVSEDALIFHQRSEQWLPIHVHPHYKNAMASQPANARPAVAVREARPLRVPSPRPPQPPLAAAGGNGSNGVRGTSATAPSAPTLNGGARPASPVKRPDAPAAPTPTPALPRLDVQLLDADLDLLGPEPTEHPRSAAASPAPSRATPAASKPPVPTPEAAPRPAPDQSTAATAPAAEDPALPAAAPAAMPATQVQVPAPVEAVAPLPAPAPAPAPAAVAAAAEPEPDVATAPEPMVVPIPESQPLVAAAPVAAPIVEHVAEVTLSVPVIEPTEPDLAPNAVFIDIGDAHATPVASAAVSGAVAVKDEADEPLHPRDRTANAYAAAFEPGPATADAFAASPAAYAGDAAHVEATRAPGGRSMLPYVAAGAVAVGVLIAVVVLRRPSAAPADRKPVPSAPAPTTSAPLSVEGAPPSPAARALGGTPSPLAIVPEAAAAPAVPKETKPSADAQALAEAARTNEREKAAREQAKADSAKAAAERSDVVAAPQIGTLGTSVEVKNDVSPEVLAARYGAAYDDAWADLVAKLKVSGFEGVFAPARLAPSGAAATRATIVAARASIGAFRTRAGTIEKAYRDSAATLAANGGWDPAEQRDWESKPKRAESGEMANQANALLNSLERVYGVLAANAQSYSVTPNGVAFSDGAVQREYWELRRGLMAQINAAGDVAARVPLQLVMKAIGSARPPESVAGN